MFCNTASFEPLSYDYNVLVRACKDRIKITKLWMFFILYSGLYDRLDPTDFPLERLCGFVIEIITQQIPMLSLLIINM